MALTRREFLLGSISTAMMISGLASMEKTKLLLRKLPKDKGTIPAVGLGTWQAFDVDSSQYPRLLETLRTFYQTGGRLVDSSPMYGRAEAIVGELSDKL